MYQATSNFKERPQTISKQGNSNKLIYNIYNIKYKYNIIICTDYRISRENS